MEIDLRNGIGSLTEFARNTRAHTEELRKTGKPKVLTHNGKASVVVLSVEAYEELAHQAYEREMDLRLRKALESYAAGRRGKPVDVALSSVRNRAVRRRRLSDATSS